MDRLTSPLSPLSPASPLNPVWVGFAYNSSSPSGLLPPPLALSAKRRLHTRHSIPSAAMPEHRHVRTGSLNIPDGPSAAAGLMPRSPPSEFAAYLRLIWALTLGDAPTLTTRCQQIRNCRHTRHHNTVLTLRPLWPPQIHPMSHASFSGRALAKPAMLVPLATTSDPHPILCASTLPRCVA